MNILSVEILPISAVLTTYFKSGSLLGTASTIWLGFQKNHKMKYLCFLSTFSWETFCQENISMEVMRDGSASYTDG